MIAPRPLRPAFVQASLARLGLDEWALIRECSRADRCSVNRCPLDPLVELRIVDLLDREKRCTVSKPDRERFVARMASETRALLPFAGLFESEWTRREAARRRFASMTPEARTRALAGRERGLMALRRARLQAVSNLTEGTTNQDPSDAGRDAKTLTTGGEPA